MFREFLFVLLLCSSAVCLGCSGRSTRPPATIEGTVTLDGKPLPQGSVHFTSPLTGESAYVNLEPGGTYSVTFPETDVGEAYEVSVRKPEIEEDDAHARVAPVKMDVKIPPKYTDRTTSGLTYEVQEEGTQTFDIELTSS